MINLIHYHLNVFLLFGLAYGIGVLCALLITGIIPIRQKAPIEGSVIKLTWLPNPRNNRSSKSCFIGEIGVVDQVGEDGSFHMTLKSGAGLTIPDKRYRYELIHLYKPTIGYGEIFSHFHNH